jgi:hypothetical protein
LFIDLRTARELGFTVTGLEYSIGSVGRRTSRSADPGLASPAPAGTEAAAPADR